MYERVNHAWNSKAFEPSWSFQQIVDEGWSPSAIPPVGHELQATASQASSTDTTLGDSSSTITVQEQNNTGNNNSSEESKTAIPIANVDFSY
jgi:hypothetical protein